MTRSRTLRTLPFAALVAGFLLTACAEEHRDYLQGNLNPEKFPTMMTRDVETFISDSGIVRYRVVTPLWLIFEEARVPHWSFPKTLELEKFDDYFQKQASVRCDSATYFEQERLWRLDGNVRITNIAKEKFLTNQLFWDDRNRKVYSDSFIHIEKSDRVIEGYGFTSNDRLTVYDVRNVSGIFPVSDLQGGTQGPDSSASPGAASPRVAGNQPARPAPKHVVSQPAPAPSGPSARSGAPRILESVKRQQRK